MSTISVDLSVLAPWVSIAISIATLIYVRRHNSSTEVSSRIAAIEGKVDAIAEGKAGKGTVDVLLKKVDVVEDKVTVIENEMKHLPDKDATHRLEIALGEMRTEMRGLSEKVKPISAMADRIQEAILEKVVA